LAAIGTTGRKSSLTTVVGETGPEELSSQSSTAGAPSKCCSRRSTEGREIEILRERMEEYGLREVGEVAGVEELGGGDEEVDRGGGEGRMK
jgi:hypothetical protein